MNNYLNSVHYLFEKHKEGKVEIQKQENLKSFP